jgi:hypothetical protein
MAKLIMGVTDIPYRGPGTTTTGDVAEILEARYGIMEKFWELHGEEIADMIAEAMQAKLENVLMGAPVEVDDILSEADLGKVAQKFRDFLDNKELDGIVPGVPTQAARSGVSHRMRSTRAVGRDPRPSFIDTGEYQAAFQAWLES